MSPRLLTCQLNEEITFFYKQPYGGTGSAQRQFNSSHCGERPIEGEGPQMPNTSTAGHCLKGNPPPSNPPCTHTQRGGEGGSIVFRTFLDFIWKHDSGRKCSFSDSLLLFCFWFNGSPSLGLHKKIQASSEKSGTLPLRPLKSVKLRTGLWHCVHTTAPLNLPRFPLVLLSFSTVSNWIIFKGPFRTIFRYWGGVGVLFSGADTTP